MAITYEFANGANWQQVWSGNFTASGVPGYSDRHYRIPEIVVPILLEQFVLAVYCTSSTNPGWWHSGGLMNVKFPTGILTGGVGETHPSERYRIWLDQITSFEIPKMAANYELSFNAPYWLDQLSISVYEYTGPVHDSTETQLNALQTDLTTLLEEFRSHSEN